MLELIAGSHAFLLGLALAGVLGTASTAVSPANAQPTSSSPVSARWSTRAGGVTDVTLGAIDLEKQPAHIEGRELRFRKRHRARRRRAVAQP